jgi:putative phosphoesterase
VKIALLGDIHGNRHALEAVLHDAHCHDVDAVWNLGDSVGYGAAPEEVVKRLRRENAVSIVGNYDEKVLRVGEGRKRRKDCPPEQALAFRWAYGHLSSSSRRWLDSLPEELRFEVEGRRILLTHGSPADPEEHITAATSARRLAELADIAGADIVITGHSHRPLVRQQNGVLFVNTGSVGRPDDGDPRACYAILELRNNRVKATHYRVRYPARQAAALVRRHGLPEIFAQMILKGISLDRLRQQRPDHETRPPFDAAAGGGDQRLEAVLSLARSCDYEVEHTLQVTRLALMLFNDLQFLHGLGPRDRFWLQCSGLLHDIGYVMGTKAHHKKACKIILETDVLPFSKRLRLIIGSIARYHRKAMPSLRHDHFARLDKPDRARVRMLAGILALADALDSSHRSLVHSLYCDVTPRQIAVHCVVYGMYEEMRQRVLEKGFLFENVFKRKLAIEWEHKPTPVRNGNSDLVVAGAGVA